MKRVVILFLVLAAVVPAGTVAAVAGEPKVTICHIPPGNPANAHTITVGESAVPAHLAHGDKLGACVIPQSPSR